MMKAMLQASRRPSVSRKRAMEDAEAYVATLETSELIKVLIKDETGLGISAYVASAAAKEIDRRLPKSTP